MLLQGSMLYFVRGYFPILSAHLAPRTFRLCNAVGFGVGSLILMTGGYLLILKMIVREDDPELELHQRLQGGDEEALNGKLLAMAEVGPPALSLYSAASAAHRRVMTWGARQGAQPCVQLLSVHTT